jgi:hypothetical protein
MRSAILAAALILSVSPVLAGSLATPAGDVILTVEGDLANTNGDGVASFDLAMLDALPQRTTVATTPWYTGEQTFSGVVVRDLLDAVGADGAVATVVALNDYASDIPMEDLRDMPVILATRINGETLSVRDKGPLFVIYPFDLDPALANEVVFGRSVWQVRDIKVH